MWSDLRATGRTTRILEQMLDTVVQAYREPFFKTIFFFSPTPNVQRHCFDVFIRKHLSKIKKEYVTLTAKNKIRFSNGVEIRFELLDEPLTPVIEQRTEKLRGLWDYLVFEDHTLYEWAWKSRFHETHPLQKVDNELFKRLYLGEWTEPENAMFKKGDFE